MKQFLRLVLISIIAISCKNDIDRTDYVIDGKAEGVYNGIRVYLNTIDERGRPVYLDTAIVINETFKMTGKLNQPGLHYITVNGTSGRYEVMLENADMKLNINKDIISYSELKGSTSHDIFNEYNTNSIKNKELLKEAIEALDKSVFLNDTVYIEKDKEALKIVEKKYNDYPYEFLKENKDSYASLPILINLLRSRNANFERLFEAFETINTNLKETSEGIKIKNRIDVLKQRIKAEKVTAIGSKAPEFSAPNPNGENVSLSEVVNKGKITIVDFWAAWCRPCRTENPNVVKIYEQYHAKGLEIIGVGLDGRRGQNNPKEAWVKAIEDDNLTWHQVSNLKYFDEIAKTYNVKSIPSMFILNNKGEIIAKNLRGESLENKIAELLN